MMVTVVSRSGRELVKGGIKLNDSVISMAYSLDFIIALLVWLAALRTLEREIRCP